ncbi:MAG: N-acetylmuramoyl-L-alanine amidase [Pseudomonadales bacterium]|nr:N-acetylmuramoyl-L-alanine amidase [Pseudomonadales bacterium]
MKLKHAARIAICTLFAVVFSTAALAADINHVRVWRAPDNTRLVFDLSGASEHRLLTLPGEKGSVQQIIVTLPNASFKADEKKIALANTPIISLRSKVDGKDVQLIIDLSARVKPKSFLLPPNNQYGDRLVLDLFDEDSPREVKTAAPAAGGMRDIVIAVDPGHGGEDPGARSQRGEYEKHITLAIARELVKKISSTPGYTAFLTRSGDYFVSLRGRTQIARNKGADLFISIHADAFKDPSARGAGVFALSPRGATSETARWLAQSENESDLVGGVNLGDKDPMLQGVLLDLSMTATVATSLDMGDQVLAQMKKIAKMHRGFVEQAGFVVLKNPDIPSLLIETGFITNAEEARNLTNPSYQIKLAQSIFTGIDRHFRAKPPMDTALAAARGGKVKSTMDKAVPILKDSSAAPSKKEVVAERDAMETLLAERAAPAKTKTVQATKPVEKTNKAPRVIKHVVKKGETLSGIASKYRVSMASVREQNRLRSNEVQVGQTLQISSTATALR